MPRANDDPKKAKVINTIKIAARINFIVLIQSIINRSKRILLKLEKRNYIDGVIIKLNEEASVPHQTSFR